jgi:hypothetical protein
MPLLKNNAAKLITLNAPHVTTELETKYPEKYKLLPAGPAVEVPQSIADTAYVKALVKTGDVSIEQGSASAPVESVEPSEYDDMTKAELVDMAEAMEIEVSSRDTKADLIAKLQAAE